MASYNKVILMGNLTRDPKCGFIDDETAVANFGLAVNKKYTSRGEQKESVMFVDVEVWRRLAETCAEYLDKGSPVLIDGELKLDRWENNKGENRSKLKVRAYNVQFLPNPKRQSDDGALPEEEML